MIKIMTCLCAAVLLSACATTPIKSTRIDDKAGLTSGHGVVALQVVNNAERLSKFHRNWTEVIAVRLDNHDELKQLAIETAKTKASAENKKFDPEKVVWEPEIYTLSPSAEGVVSSQLFVGSMPAGEYMITSLYAYYSDGNMSSWVQMPVRAAGGIFNVAVSQLTSLGTLVFQPLLDVKAESFWSNRSSSKAYVTRIGESNLSEYVVAKYPSLTAALDTTVLQGWQDDAYQSYRQQLAEQSQQNAWGNTSVALQHHGKSALMARFGLLHWQDNSGQWRKVKLPTNAQLSAVLETEEKFVVGAERGQFFIADTPAGQWQHVQPVMSSEAIVWLGQGNDRFYAMTQSSTAFTLYQFAELNASWQQIGEFKRKEFAFLVQYGGVFAFINPQGQLAVLNDGQLHQFDPVAQSWSAQKSQAMVKLTQLQDGSLLGLAVSQWDGVGDQMVSNDGAQTWQSLHRSLGLFGDRAAEISLPAKLDDGTLVTISRVRQDQKNSKMHLVTSQSQALNNKSSWQTRGQVREDCTVMLPELSHDQTLYLMCNEGDVISTGDFGNSWQTVIDIDVPAMQHSFEQLLEALQQQNSQETTSD